MGRPGTLDGRLTSGLFRPQIFWHDHGYFFADRRDDRHDLGTAVSGIMFDIYGNYDLAFKCIAFCSLAGGLCFWFAKPPKLLQQTA